MTIVEFLNARLDEDEWWAREASRPDGHEGIPAGDHWQWENYPGDKVLPLDPAQQEYLTDEHSDDAKISLRSREKYPTRWVGELPNFAISLAEEVPTTVACHIVRHDPARVLAEVEAKRKRIEVYELAVARQRAELDDYSAWVAGEHGGLSLALDGPDPKLIPGLEFALKCDAMAYADHPGFRDEWRVTPVS